MKKALIFIFSFVCSLSVNAQYGPRGGESAQQGSSGGGVSRSFSGMMFDVDGYYGKAKSAAKPIALTSEPTKSNEFDTTSTMVNLKLGAISSDGWYVGALYSDREDSGGNTSVSGHGGGAGVGFFGNNGLSLRAFYKFSEVYGNYQDGEGFSGEATYLIKISKKIYFGFLISHQQIRYSANPKVAQFREWTSKWTHPAITLAYLMR